MEQEQVPIEAKPPVETAPVTEAEQTQMQGLFGALDESKYFQQIRGTALRLEYMVAETFIVGCGEQNGKAVFHFYPPRCFAEDKVREARRKSYILHKKIPTAFQECWKEVFGEAPFFFELMDEESTGISGVQGLGRDSWCLRVPNIPLDSSTIPRFNQLLTLFNEKLKPLLEVMSR